MAPDSGSPPPDAPRALSAAEERFRALTESSAELIAVLDAAGTYQYVSPQFERELGLESERLVGTPARDWIHPDDVPNVVSRYRHAIESGRSQKAVYRMRDCNGRWRWLSGSATPFLTGGADLRMIAACRDITREMALHEQLHTMRDLEHRVAELSRRFLSLPPHELSDEVRESVRIAGGIARADRALLYLLDPDDPTRTVDRVVWCVDGVEDAEAAATPAADLRLGLDARQLLDGEILHLPDAAAVGSEAQRARARARGLRSLLAVPLRCGDRILGFHVYECLGRERSWSEEEITLLRLLAEICAVALERQRREAALRENEARFRALTDHLGDLIFELDERGHLLYAGKSFHEHLGQPGDRLVGLPLRELIHAADRTNAEATLLAAPVEGEPAQARFRLLRRDGAALWVEASVRAFQTESREIHFAGVARDVTEHRAEVEALERNRRSEQHLSDLYRRFLDLPAEAVHEGIREGLEQVASLVGADRASLTAEADGQRIVVTTGIWESEGKARHERRDADHFRGHSALRSVLAGHPFVIPDTTAIGEELGGTRERLLARGARAVLGMPVLQEGRLIAYLSLECTGAPRAWSEREVAHARRAAELFTGAIQRSRAEGDLRRHLNAQRRVVELSNRLLAAGGPELERALVEALATTADIFDAQRSFVLSFGSETQEPVGPRREDNPFGQFEWCARPGLESFVEPDEFAVHTLLERGFLLVPKVDELPPAARSFQRTLAERGVQSALAVGLRVGQRFIGVLGVESIGRARPWNARDLAQLHTIGAFFASTLERLQTEVALRDGQTQMLHAQKMEAVGRLAGGIAHDFNNILTVILGFSRALLRESPPESELREDIQEIHDSAERAAGLTRQLLTFSRRQPQQNERVRLNDVVQGVERLLQRLLGEDIELLLELSDDVGSVHGDAAQLEQAIVNLSVNARDAMPQGGSLRIRTRRDVPDPGDARRLGLSPGAAYAVLDVQDAGEGVEPDAREHIFEPFFTTKDPGKGTGLGLAIVYSVVSDAGGAVDLESELGKGSCFRVYLPLAEDAEATIEPEASPDPTPMSGTVLLAEDEVSVRRLVKRVLEGAGYDVLDAEDGESALALADARQGALDLLVTDVVMPGMGGLELAERLAERRPDLPVLFLSGYPQERGGGGAFPLPPDRFLQKPFRDGELLDRIARLLRAAE